MSLEQAITDNTAALKALTAAVTAGMSSSGTSSTSKPTDTSAADAKAKAAADAKAKAAADAKAKAAAAKAAAAETVDEPVSEVTFDELQAKGREVAKLDKESGSTNVRSLLKKFGAAKLGEVKVEQFDDLYAAFAAVLDPASEPEPSDDADADLI